MRQTPLAFSPPPIGDDEIAEVLAALRSGWITTGPRTRAFENKFRDFTGAEAALAVNSGTAAMHIALAALGVKPGDAVITTALTFCCGVHVIEQVGARPILVDVEPDTLNIDPAAVERAAANLLPGERLAAIMPVHLYGHSADRDPLIRIAQKYGCALVEDCAHSFPAGYKGKAIGAAEDAGIPIVSAFSFYATKNLTTGEGGMMTGPADLIEEGRLWSLHGMSRDAWKRYQGAQGSWFYEVTRPGFKYNMTDIQAALGMVQLDRVRGFGVRRAEIAARYNEAFREYEELTLPAHRQGIDHAWHVYSLRLNLDRLDISRSEFIVELGKRNIAASVHFIPIHLHPYYRDRYSYRPEDFPVAYGEYQKLVSLPIYPTMKDSDVSDVIEAVTDILTENVTRNRQSAARLAAAQA
jgi:dTDP-4-amino-4,6-dideoxygalactose transaminase